jgi:sugar/nucleoside kinase (ribokinase family)
MADRHGIAVAGNWITDKVKIVDNWPAEEHLANILEEECGTGGAPYNVAVGLATLDPALPVEGIGVVGDDADGAGILEHLRRLGIGASLMHTAAGARTSYTDVMTVRSTGRRTFFHNRGANALLGPEHFDFAALRARILHLGYLMLLDRLDAPDPVQPGRSVAAGVLEKARTAGIMTSVDIVTDLGPRLSTVVKPALVHTDFFIANELEGGAIAGIHARKDGHLIQGALPRIADAILRLGVQRVVVIHAPEGAHWKGRDGQELFQPSLAVPRDFIRGTAGAGDAFASGMLLGLHEGWEAKRCLEMAVANAAMCLADPTCTAGLRPMAEALGLIGRFGVRPA